MTRRGQDEESALRGRPHQLSDEAWNMRLVGHTDFDGTGDCMHVNIKDGVAFVGHQLGGTSIVDVRDPTDPRRVGYMPVPDNTHSHKVQVLGDILLVNRERSSGSRRLEEPWLGGLSVFDISDPLQPQEIGYWPCGGRGVHRMTYWEEPFAYVSAGAGNYTSQFLVILDLSNPARPQEVGRWWLPGMRSGEEDHRNWSEDSEVLLHHALPRGDRLYCSWWDAGFVILDISELSDPQLVSHVKLNEVDEPSKSTHSVCPLPGRDALVVVDECVEDVPHIPYQVRLIDISDEKNPRIASRLPVPEGDFHTRGGRFGPHNVHEPRPGAFQDGNRVFLTYFNGGVRVYDVSDLDQPKEVAYYIPKAPPSRPSIQMNDILVDGDGLIYATDRTAGGLYILEMDGA